MAKRPLDLEPLLKPQSIAVVGASERPGVGRQVLENLCQLGFRGAVYPVNPNYERVLGLRSYPSLREVARAGHRPDLVAILLQRDAVIPVLEEAAEIGVRAAWAFASGFAEAGDEGQACQAALARICRDAEIAFCGPNCVGVINPLAPAGTYSAPISPLLRGGEVGVVAQSGSICLALANSDRGVGYSLLVSSGNEAVLDATDYIDYLVDDPTTRVILAFIEEFRRPDRLLEVADRAREARKPVILLKVGRSEAAQRAAVAHTGALAGSDAVHDAVFEKFGLLRVSDLDEMLETAEAFVRLGNRLPKGNRVGLITLSGGEIGLLADAALGLDLVFSAWSEGATRLFQASLPAHASISNPLDAWGSGKIEETYPPCIRAAAGEDGIDLVILSQDAPPGLAPAQVDQYRVVAEAARDTARATDKPIVAISNLSGGLHPELRQVFEEGGIPLLQGTRAGLLAVDHVVRFAQTFRPPHGVRAVRAGDAATAASLPHGSGVVDEHAAREALTVIGLRAPREQVCQSEGEAIAAFRAIGGPVAVKVLSPEIPHKTEAGGVALDLRNEASVREAFRTVSQRALARVSTHRITGVLVQEMVQGIVAEAILGVIRDRSFGPVVVFGSGGTWVEILQDRALALPPLSEDEARRMVSRTKLHRLLEGFRGKPVGDVDAVVRSIVSVGDLALQWGKDLVALEVNPLLVLPRGEGVVAVDVLIEFRSSRETKGSGA